MGNLGRRQFKQSPGLWPFPLQVLTQFSIPSPLLAYCPWERHPTLLGPRFPLPSQSIVIWL